MDKRKIAFDIHGVLDTFDYFKDLIDMHRTNGDEIIIMTGQKYDDEIKALFKEKDIYFDQYFSVIDWLEAKGIEIDWKEGGGFADDCEWDIVKRDICLLHEIDVIYDDSPIYRDTFHDIPTLFLHVVNSKRVDYRSKCVQYYLKLTK